MPLSCDEAVLSDLLEDLSASQPPAPPDRYRAVRRRAFRRLWHQVATAGVALAVLAAGLTLMSSRPPAALARPAAAYASLPTTKGGYLGVYEAGGPRSYQPVAEFATAAGEQPNLIGDFTNYPEPFPRAFAESAHDHGAAPLVQIDPAGVSLSAIAAGAYDAQLRAYANSVRTFRHPVVIGFGHDMNGFWYSWGDTHVSPATFVAAWRRIVTVFRAQGAVNVTWLWTVADISGTEPLSAWWPGSRYVTWVGVDGSYDLPSDTFSSVFGTTIDQVRQFTRKPVLLSQAAVWPQVGQTVKILDLFHGMATYDTLGLVWFDIAQHSPGVQDPRIEDNQAAVYAFRLGVRDELSLVPVR